jgi:hypothetical protein
VAGFADGRSQVSRIGTDTDNLALLYSRMTYIFRPLPLDVSEVFIQPDAIEADLLDLHGLKQALGYAS